MKLNRRHTEKQVEMGTRNEGREEGTGKGKVTKEVRKKLDEWEQKKRKGDGQEDGISIQG